MGLFDLSVASDDLEDLLERERAAVLAGRFDLLERLGDEKERLVRIVDRDGATPETLARLRAETERNGLLLEAMRSGVMAAQARVQAMQQPKEPLQTYDASGHKKNIVSAPKIPGHRA